MVSQYFISVIVESTPSEFKTKTESSAFELESSIWKIVSSKFYFLNMTKITKSQKYFISIIKDTIASLEMVSSQVLQSLRLKTESKIKSLTSESITKTKTKTKQSQSRDRPRPVLRPPTLYFMTSTEISRYCNLQNQPPPPPLSLPHPSPSLPLDYVTMHLTTRTHKYTTRASHHVKERDFI